MTKVFIDGSAGTAGLRIHSRLENRADLELITLTGEARKDPAARKAALNSCDLAVLCLPDAARREAVAMIENPAVRVVDTSTAHRVAPGWAYGFPELSAARREAIVSGARPYGLGQTHKHLPEMQGITGLDCPPVFCPIVADYYCGMVVTVPLFAEQLNPGFGIEDVKACYAAKYTGPVVKYTEAMDQGGFIDSNALAGKDSMEVAVFGNAERMLLVSRFDNLGKGASGAAVQCINLMLGADETTGLVL